MALTKRNPFMDLLFFQERMSRLFDDAFAKYRGGPGSASGIWFPPVDIYESSESIIIKAELPGIDRKHVSIEMNGDTLVLKGERKLAGNRTEENYHRMECFYGTFYREFPLPHSVDSSKIKASFKDGVLKIVIDKAASCEYIGVKVKVE